ncbi:MAG: TetR/AcrR family transcriptional regulator [Clostridiaceae bacterium]
MARPIEYNKDEVLSKAMRVFWLYGYESTSMKDLVEATGMTTRSMYNIFKSKNGLFKAILEWYYKTNMDRPYENLIEENGLSAVRKFALAVADLLDQMNSKTPMGCLFTNTMSERNCVDIDSFYIVDEYFNKLEEAFKSKLQYAIECENYKGDYVLRAKQLIVMIQGLSVYSKNSYADRDCRMIVDDFLTLIDI